LLFFDNILILSLKLLEIWVFSELPTNFESNSNALHNNANAMSNKLHCLPPKLLIVNLMYPTLSTHLFFIHFFNTDFFFCKHSQAASALSACQSTLQASQDLIAELENALESERQEKAAAIEQRLLAEEQGDALRARLSGTHFHIYFDLFVYLFLV
jgi:4-diphosphocytidyl-2C-methyl-D-erythritol kinase